ncbi:hypothetical protein [Kibdelosporangium phytohabitans]|uniref:Gram-positive cocci surface proteins LPxTG domain-containing protein n=1 Tax=Kibdelosporangium phytohabitans TaxID=860235 RepID=A0A0N9I0I7_9PSEU|nr:hypothetical protein [Kibdelosporangium phytohabitans]ALG09515.1 hypothetical protein AOZ06_23735 [Kibdelosporangium phytohabitans]MBE1469180.1 hypothetical protein [Kibdelosporangium phytohabitans]
MTYRHTRALTGSAAIGLALLLTGGTAAASPVTAAPSPSDATAAAQTAAAPETTTRLAKFFVNLDKQTAGQLAQGTPDVQAVQAKAPRVTGPARPVYSLTPDFVRSADAPVATFVYMAVPAKSASGQDASILLSRKGAGWSIHQITTGTEAFASTGTVFTEPQNNAWYRLDGDRVLPLNQPAASSVGKDGTTVAKYQELVHGRYADKLPGSDYQRQHKLGGYSSGPTTTTPDDGGAVSPLLIVLVGAGIAGLGAVALVARRRRA